MMYLFCYLAIGMVISFGIVVADWVNFLRGENDGDMDVWFLAMTIFVWPFFLRAIWHGYLEHRRETKRRR
jgi:purine-cytosine permease-like protein